MKLNFAKGQKCWFTSDHHFGHENILKYTDRDFDSIDFMNQKYIWNWNHVVKPQDVVFHLGDFTLRDSSFAKDIFPVLNGIVFVLSNKEHHDRFWLPEEEFWFGESNYTSRSGKRVVLLPPLVSLGSPQYPNEQGYPLTIVLCHYPLEVWDRKHYGSIHLHGHIHDEEHHDHQKMERRINVGVDFTDGYPVSLDEVLEKCDE